MPSCPWYKDTILTFEATRPNSVVPLRSLPVVIATEILGALAIVLGWKTRLAAFLLAGHALLTAVICHHHFADQIELVLLLTDVSIAGGLLLLVANGSGPLSLDHRGTT